MTTASMTASEFQPAPNRWSGDVAELQFYDNLNYFFGKARTGFFGWDSDSSFFLILTLFINFNNLALPRKVWGLFHCFRFAQPIIS